MSNEQMDIIGIGAALVDVFADITEEDLSRLNMPKGAMTLIDINASKDLLDQINVHTSTVGGLGGKRRRLAKRPAYLLCIMRRGHFFE